MKIKRRKQGKYFIPLASMGDIAFLLIIFFMVTSNFMKEAHVDMEEARSIDIERMKAAPVSVSVDKDGKIWLQGQETQAESLQGLVTELIEHQKEKLVTLRIDKAIKHDVYGPVIMSLSKAGVQIALTGQPKAD